MHVRTWVDKLYCWTRGGEDLIDQVIDHLFDEVDERFRDGKFDEVNEGLGAVDLGFLPTDLIVALLCITAQARDKLPNRKLLVERAEARFRSREAPERVEELMKGLR